MGRFALQGSARTPMPGARSTGPADPAERLEVSLILRLQNAEALKTHVDKAHKGEDAPHLTREGFAQTHGASGADLKAVADFAAAHGLAVVQQDAARRTVVVSGTVAQAEAAFGVALETFVHDGGTYRGRTGDITLPAELQGIVVAVLGLDNRPAAEPRFRVREGHANVRWSHHLHANRHKKKKPAPTPAPHPPPPPPPPPPVASGPSSYTPLQLASLYGFPAGDGAGQCIGIVELGGGFRPADLATYFQSLGVTPPTVVAVSVDQGANAPTGSSSGPDGEVMLDIEVAGAIAPAARIAVYFAPNTDAGFLDAITTAIHDPANKPSVISISWGGPESGFTAQSLAAFDAAFQTAAALGVSICVASGDNGSGDGVGDGADHVDFPAASPNCLACGGTSIATSGGAITHERVWNNPSGGAGGGGVSATFPAPAYQQGLHATKTTGAAQALTMRGVPDVCGDADPQTGYAVLVDGSQIVVGGTSCVAPLWAGLIARINGALGRPVGFFHPKLYATASALNDVVDGENGDFEATPGWDACTGLGSPKGAAVAAALGAPAATS